MTSGPPPSGPPDRSSGRTPEQNRAPQIALFVIGVAVVLLLSSVTWFSSDQTGVGIAQIVCGVVVAGVGGYLLRRAGTRA